MLQVLTMSTKVNPARNIVALWDLLGILAAIHVQLWDLNNTWYFSSGHDGVVHSACWSHDSQWLLTCSSDRSARVWGVGHKEPLLLSLTTTLHNFQSTAGESFTAAKVCVCVLGVSLGVGGCRFVCVCVHE